MTADITDLPTPEFRAHLEWEIARTIRREARLGTHRHTQRHRWVRTALIVTVCLALGTASNFASAQVRNGVRRDSLLDAARAELSIVQLRQELVRKHLDEVARKFQAGVVGAAEFASVESELRVMEARTVRAQLNIEEIQAASLPARNDLNAPLVGGRDFVRQRIEVELTGAQQRLSALEQQASEVERQRRLGTATELSVAQAQLEVARAQAELAVMAERLSLRREFVEQGTPVDQLTRRLDSSQLREDLQLARRALNVAQRRAEAAKLQHAVGALSDLDLMRAELDVKECELALAKLAQQLKRLGEATHPR